jgi:antitoxin component YwqK of YwqJK toxin-antitoxin module
MNNMLKKLIQEEFEGVMSKKYSEDEISRAIFNKDFVHTNNGKVYSPVSLKNGVLTGVDSDNQHVEMNLDEVAMIESAEERFRKNTK